LTQAAHLALDRNLAATCLLKDLRRGIEVFLVILDIWLRIGEDFDNTCRQWMEGKNGRTMPS
jgi:hypothetical protein